MKRKILIIGVLSIVTLSLLFFLHSPKLQEEQQESNSNYLNDAGMSADGVIDRYISAVGGREIIAQIKTLYIENTTKIMGMHSNSTTTILNGKGYRTESKIMGVQTVTCYNEKAGWTFNSKASPEIQPMTQSQYELGKNQINICSPFLDYKKRGYKVRLSGNQMIDGIQSIKIKMISSDGNENVYYFDTATAYLIKSEGETGMHGEKVKISLKYSNYQETPIGYFMPFSTEMNIEGIMSFTTKTKRVVVNMPVNSAMFYRL